jgi:hypothetical protein
VWLIGQSSYKHSRLFWNIQVWWLTLNSRCQELNWAAMLCISTQWNCVHLIASRDLGALCFGNIKTTVGQAQVKVVTPTGSHLLSRMAPLYILLPSMDTTGRSCYYPLPSTRTHAHTLLNNRFPFHSLGAKVHLLEMGILPNFKRLLLDSSIKRSARTFKKHTAVWLRRFRSWTAGGGLVYLTSSDPCANSSVNVYLHFFTCTLKW